MSRRTLGILLLLAASALAGLVLGQWFYSLFLKTVPPLALSSFNQAAAHAAFLLYGAVAGLAIFLLSLLAVVLSRFFEEPESEAQEARPASGGGSSRR
ncbi:MAG TPA: hypothetical protein VGK94_15885 [Candidatus Polarisedimenticolia bacterium]